MREKFRPAPCGEKPRPLGAPLPRTITFRYKNYRREGADRQQLMTLATDEFIRRFLLHVMPKGFHRIRHCGLLAGSARKASLALARELLNVAAPSDDDTMDDPDNFRPPCPCCGGRMIVIEVFERRRQPRGPPHGSPSTGSSTPLPRMEWFSLQLQALSLRQRIDARLW